MTNYWPSHNLVSTGRSSLRSEYQYLPSCNRRYSSSQRIPRYVAPTRRAVAGYDHGQNGLHMEIIIRLPPIFNTEQVQGVPLRIHSNVPKWQGFGSESFVVKVKIPGSNPKYVSYPLSVALKNQTKSVISNNMCERDVSSPLLSVDALGNLYACSHTSILGQPYVKTRNIVVNLVSRVITQDDDARLSLPELSLSSSLSSDPSTSPPASVLEARMQDLDISYSVMRNTASKIEQPKLMKQVTFSEVVEHIGTDQEIDFELILQGSEDSNT